MSRRLTLALNPALEAALTAAAAGYVEDLILPAPVLADALEQFFWDMHNCCTNTTAVPPRLARLQERAWADHLATCPGCARCTEVATASPSTGLSCDPSQ